MNIWRCRAAGAQLGYQSAYASDVANLQEAVFFEYTDASGMSQRTTDRTGAAVATGDGGEGSPVETDPLGGNVGTSTPYIELLPPFEPAPEYPMLQQYFDDAPQYVNGQRVTCTLDGMAIGCSRARDMLETGSAIPAALAPYQNLPGFQFNSHGNGIFTVEIPRQVGWNVTYNGPNDTQGTANPVYSGTNSYTFSISWATVIQKTPIEQRPSSSGNKSFTKQQIKDALADCLSYLFDEDVELQSFDQAEDGINGSLRYKIGNISYFIGTDVVSFSGSQLAAIETVAQGEPFTAFGSYRYGISGPFPTTLNMQGYGYDYNGREVYIGNNLNYVANDIRNHIEFRNNGEPSTRLAGFIGETAAGQIHEDAHLIYNQWIISRGGTGSADNPSNNEVGYELENCVADRLEGRDFF